MKNGISYALSGTAIGIILGFMLANGYARAEIERKRLTVAVQMQPKQTSSTSLESSEKDKSGQLTVNELRQAIAHADNQPGNAKLQEEMGMALFHYASIEQNTELLADAVRLMERAEVTGGNLEAEFFAALGAANFVLGRNKNPENMLKARRAYQKALRLNPKNLDLQIDLGLTYFFAQPPEPQTAVKVFNQVLRNNPSHERSLENIVRVLLETGDINSAMRNMEKLKQVNPANPVLKDLQTQLEQAQL